MLFGRIDLARQQLIAARPLLGGLIAKDPTNDIWNLDLAAQLDELDARLLAQSGRTGEAVARADHAIALLSKRKDSADPVMRAVYAAVLLVRGDMHLRAGQRARARADWQGVDRLTSGTPENLPSSLLTLRYASARRQGNQAAAAPIRQVLDQRGWGHPVYLRELR